MATPDTRNSIVIRKSFSYRGGTKEWTNRYHFEGDVPASSADWTTFADAIVAGEKTIYKPDVTIIEAVGYDCSTATASRPNGDAVFTKTYSVVGTLGGTGIPAPGDCAVMVKYHTPAKSSKNHPVYLMNYYHGALINAAGGDELDTTQTTAVENYADDWISGYSDGTANHERCGPRGAVATSRNVSGYARHRDFPL
jgi:hypothetical protein